MFDGEQKISKWPKNAKAYIQSNPKATVRIGQSICCKHKLSVGRMRKIDIFIGYNSQLHCFVVWNVPPNIKGLGNHDDVILKLSTRSQNLYKANPVFSGFYEVVKSRRTPTSYQKICVFPEKDFIDFYNNYETYMKPNKQDIYYQTPVVDLSLQK